MKNLIYYIIFFSYVLRECSPYYQQWVTPNKIKHKLKYLIYELVIQAISNVDRIDHFKDVYAKFPGYHIGQIVFDIRRKYARMVLVYRRSFDGLTAYYPDPHNVHIQRLEEVQRIGKEIYHLVEMLEEWEEAYHTTKMTRRIRKHTTLSFEQILADRYKKKHGRVRFQPAESKREMKPIGRQNKIFNISQKYLAQNDGGGFDSDMGF